MPHISKYPPKSDMAARRKYVKRYGLPEGVEHGASAYTNWGCRDDFCREDFAIKNHNARMERFAKTEANGGIAPTEVHNKNTYQNWACRCDPCIEDYSENRSQKQKAA